MEIVKQQEFTFEGNDCLIKDVAVMIYIHETYIVQLIRRYYGWCDNGLDYRYKKEFNNQTEADAYYNWLLKIES